jgi:hypothetical protein
MARVAKPTKTATKPGATKRKPGRLAAVAQKSRGNASKATAAPKRTPFVVPPVPKVSKDDLRAQVEKLEGTVATLRAKNREANRAAKTAAARIAELEDQVAPLEKKAASEAATPKRDPKPSSPVRGGRRKKAIDLGDAAPPGAAVEDLAAFDQEAENARENPEEHLGSE